MTMLIFAASAIVAVLVTCFVYRRDPSYLKDSFARRRMLIYAERDRDATYGAY